MANRILLKQAEYGESNEALEKNWQKWLHHIPFDAPVARRLSELYSRHLGRLNPTSDAGAVQRLKRKLRQTENRAKRYAIEAFEH
jgi:hypothetical protein